MRFNSLILLLSSLITVVVAGHPYQYTPLDIAQYTCNAWITNHNPVCLAPKEWGGHNYDCYCNSIPAFATIMDCFINGYSNSSQIINGFAKVCNMTYDSMYIKYQLALNFNTIAFRNFSFDMLSKRWDTLTEDQLAKTPFLYNYTNGSFAVYQKSYELFYQNTNHSIVYSTILFIYWAVILLFATIINFVLKKYLGCMINAFIGKFVNWYRKNIGLPAAFNKSKCKEVSYSGGLFSGFIPSRLESLILAGFIILTIVFSGLNIYHIPGNPKDPTVRQELSGLIATRTGVLVQYLVILSILFAGRNNFFQWLTGWKYSTFLTYHRWISRVVIALVFVHGVTYAIYDKANGTFARNMKTNNVVWGTVACVCGGFIFLFGMIFFRIRTYEFFYVSHVLLVIFFVVGTLYHVKPLSYDDYYWAAVAVWVFDRVIRLLKMFSFGIKTAELELVADETIRITIPTPRSWKPRPGGHVFIHFLTSTRFWQSHPFTIGLNEEDSFILYCKVKTGITLALYDKLSNTPNRISSMKVLVEGPYGESSPARRCRNMVYVAGGNGIPGLYAESVDVDKKAPENKTIKLVWIIRNWKSVLWFVDELKRLKDTRVQPTVFITRPDDLNGLEYFNELGSHKKPPHNPFEDEKENIEKSDTKSADLSIYSYPNSVIANLRGELPNVEFVEGKPSMDALVEYETANTDSSIAFITCGHPVMVDELRRAVTQNLDNTKYRVDYFEQLQNW